MSSVSGATIVNGLMRLVWLWRWRPASYRHPERSRRRSRGIPRWNL